MGAFILRFSTYGRLFLHYLKALWLRFSPFGGPFSSFKSLSATFFLYVEAFLLRFSCGEGFWRPFCYFFSPCGSVVFGFMGTLFGLPHPLPKFRQGLMPACPLTPMSSMQYNHPLTASCHFRDILIIVTKYFLIYIFAWLTIFKIRKRNETTFSNSKYCFLSIYGIYFYWNPMKSDYFDFLFSRNENTYINLV